MFTISPRLKKRIAVALCWLSLTLACGVAVAQDEPAKTILIGFVGALSGVSEGFGKSLANAADMALAETNRQNPRIGGQRVFFRLLRQDDRNDPETAVAATKQLLQEGVVAVIGTANSGTTLAIAKILADAGVPLVAPAASATMLAEQGYGNFFRIIGHDDQASADLVDYTVRVMNLRRFAVVDNGTVYGTAVAASVFEQVRQSGAKAVMRERISLTSDLRQMVRRAKQSGAEALFFGGYTSQAVLLAQLIQQEGGGLRLLLASNGAVGSTYLIAARSAANDVIAIEAGIPTANMPGWRRFEEDYTQRFGLNLFGFTPFAYDAAQLLVAAMRQGGSVKPARIIETLRQISFKGLTGVISFDAIGNPRVPIFTVYEVQNQRWVPLQTYEEIAYPPARRRSEQGEGAAVPTRKP